MSGNTSENPEEIRKESAFAKFDAVCDAQNLTPAQLAAKDDAALIGWMREQMPEKTKNQPVDASMLRLLLSEYVADAG